MKTRTEKDSLGPKEVPADALYGIQTLRAVENFPVSGWRFSRSFIRALALIKKSAAEVNLKRGDLDPKVGGAIVQAAGRWRTGNGTINFPWTSSKPVPAPPPT